MDKVSLTASMRSNLLSLQNISRQVDSTQNRLSTGKKVNSAIDNPSSYYTARSLSNRANDLDALLASMGQAVSTIKAATQALESAADFLEQAKAVATQAQETAQSVVAHVSTEDELLAAINSGKQGLIVIDSSITLSENQTLNLKGGQSLVGNQTNGELIFNMTDTAIINAVNMGNNSSVSNLNITFNSTGRNSLFAVENKQGVSFSNLNVDFNAEKNYALSQQLNVFYLDNSKANISNKINIKAVGHNIKAILATNQSNVELIKNSEFNFDIDGEGIGRNQRIAEIINKSVLNINSGVKLNGNIEGSNETKALYASSEGVINIINAEVNIFNNNCGNTFNYALTSNSGGKINVIDNSILNIKSIGETFTALEIDTVAPGSYLKFDNSEIHIETDCTKSSVISILKPNGTSSVKFSQGSKLSIKDNNNPANDGYWELNKDWSKEVDTSGSSVNINDFNSITEFIDTGETYQMFTDLPEINFDTVVWDSVDTTTDSSQYTSIISQYDSLIKDASYKGVNLLQEQDLKVTFNEGRTSWLDVLGKDASSAALGLTTLEWNSKEDIEKSIEELTNAMNQIRSMSSELGSYYNIVLTRQDFTENLINVLEEGADKLTLADMNEESANMLALQTRQQLATNSLSLASQAAQSILRLF